MNAVLRSIWYVFVYQISTNTKGPTFDTGGRAFDSLYITPKNNVTITWNQSGTLPHTGIELFDSSLNFLRQVARAGGELSRGQRKRVRWQLKLPHVHVRQAPNLDAVTQADQIGFIRQ